MTALDVAAREPIPVIHASLALQLALRQLRLAPVSVLCGALTLAIGLGAATSIYSVMMGFDAPLPVPEGAGVMRAEVLDPEQGRSELSARDVLAWQQDSRSIETLGVFSRSRAAVATAGRAARLASSAEISPETFELLRVSPLIGRLPTEPSAQDAGVVLSHRLWRSWLDADPEALGATLRVDGEVRTLVAVMPEGFRFPFREDLWLLRSPGAEPWQDLSVAMRLEDGVSQAAAAEELQTILRRSRLESGGEPSTVRVAVRGFTEARGERSETTMLFGLLVMVLALVLVSCSNVSNLLLERATVRARGLAAHQSLGAHPAQVVLLVLTEALLVALLGAALGIFVALAVVVYIEQTLADRWGYFWMRVELEPSALLFISGLAIATAVVSGTAPALRVLRTNLAGVLQQDSRSTLGRGKPWGSWLLITGQVTFSCLAVVASVLMALGLLESRHVVDGFPADEVSWSTLSLESERYQEAESLQPFTADVLDALEREPVVGRAALSTGLPGLHSPSYRITESGAPLEETTRRVATTAVTPGYFEVFGLTIDEGRGFYDYESEAVAIVSRDFVEIHFGGSPAIGRSIDVHRAAGLLQVRIVGIVADLLIYPRDRGRDLDHVYLPLPVETSRRLFATARIVGDGQGVGAAFGRAVRAADAEVPVDKISSLADTLAYLRQFLETLGTLAVLGGLGAVFVVAIGLYGIVSFDVSRRIPEFGLRLALGAPIARVAREVVGKGLLLVLPGMVLGLGLTYLVTPLLGFYLGGADSHDPRIFGGAVLVYFFIALIASGLPARRAASCNPGDVLRDG